MTVLSQSGTSHDPESQQDSALQTVELANQQYGNNNIVGDENNTAALPVELDEVGVSLPTPEEARHNSFVNHSVNADGNGVGQMSNSRKSMNLKWVCIGTVLALVVLVVVVPAVALSQSSNNGASSNKAATTPTTNTNTATGTSQTLDLDSNASPPGSEPNLNPENRPRANLQDVIAYMVGQGVSNMEDFQNESSPQARAASWLATADPANWPVPDSNQYNIESDVGYWYMTRYIMVVNYYALGGEDWADQMYFLTKADVCLWHTWNDTENYRIGVFCPKYNLPDELILDFPDMVGTIPKENGMLSRLAYLHITGSDGISGNIPEELCKLTSIKSLNLSRTSLEGGIPECLSVNLKYLDLSQNQLDGTIPTTLGDNTGLEQLWLYDNQIYGYIPTELGKIGTLISLALANNLLIGDVPSSLTQLSNLVELRLDGNRGLVENPLPILDTLPKLKHLFLNDCGFMGKLDDTSLINLEGLVRLDMSNNEFTGNIPAHFFSNPNLEILDLALNQLEGGLSMDGVGESIAINLTFLSLHGNNLSGQVPEALSSLYSLELLDLSDNEFTGPMPDIFGSFPFLYSLFLSENNFDPGPVPSTLASQIMLFELSLRNTGRTGQLPGYIGDTPDHAFFDLIDLSENSFTGNIPESYGNLEGLKFIFLSQNPGLSGLIPTGLGNMPQLHGVYIDGTGITGNLDDVCDNPVFLEKGARNYIFADCGGTTPTILCDCGCTCCDPASGGCSDPLLGNVEGALETAYSRFNMEEMFIFENNTEYFGPDELSGDFFED